MTDEAGDCDGSGYDGLEPIAVAAAPDEIALLASRDPRGTARDPTVTAVLEAGVPTALTGPHMLTTLGATRRLPILLGGDDRGPERGWTPFASLIVRRHAPTTHEVEPSPWGTGAKVGRDDGRERLTDRQESTSTPDGAGTPSLEPRNPPRDRVSAGFPTHRPTEPTGSSRPGQSPGHSSERETGRGTDVATEQGAGHGELPSDPGTDPPGKGATADELSAPGGPTASPETQERTGQERRRDREGVDRPVEAAGEPSAGASEGSRPAGRLSRQPISPGVIGHRSIAVTVTERADNDRGSGRTRVGSPSFSYRQARPRTDTGPADAGAGGEPDTTTASTSAADAVENRPTAPDDRPAGPGHRTTAATDDRSVSPDNQPVLARHRQATADNRVGTRSGRTPPADERSDWTLVTETERERVATSGEQRRAGLGTSDGAGTQLEQLVGGRLAAGDAGTRIERLAEGRAATEDASGAPRPQEPLDSGDAAETVDTGVAPTDRGGSPAGRAPGRGPTPPGLTVQRFGVGPTGVSTPSRVDQPRADTAALAGGRTHAETSNTTGGSRPDGVTRPPGEPRESGEQRTSHADRPRGSERPVGRETSGAEPEQPVTESKPTPARSIRRTVPSPTAFTTLSRGSTGVGVSTGEWRPPAGPPEDASKRGAGGIESPAGGGRTGDRLTPTLTPLMTRLVTGERGGVATDQRDGRSEITTDQPVATANVDRSVGERAVPGDRRSPPSLGFTYLTLPGTAETGSPPSQSRQPGFPTLRPAVQSRSAAEPRGRRGEGLADAGVAEPAADAPEAQAKSTGRPRTPRLTDATLSEPDSRAGSAGVGASTGEWRPPAGPPEDASGRGAGGIESPAGGGRTGDRLTPTLTPLMTRLVTGERGGVATDQRDGRSEITTDQPVATADVDRSVGERAVPGDRRSPPSLGFTYLTLPGTAETGSPPRMPRLTDATLSEPDSRVGSATGGDRGTVAPTPLRLQVESGPAGIAREHRDRSAARAGASSGQRGGRRSGPPTSTGGRGDHRQTEQADSGTAVVTRAARAAAGGEKLMTVGAGGRTTDAGEQTEMPSLTLQRPAGGAAGQGGQSRSSQPSSTDRSGGRSDTAGSAEPASRPSQSQDISGTPAPSVRADRPGGAVPGTSRGARSAASGGTRDDVGHGSRPPEGRETAPLYPDLTVKRLAPRIDVTRRETRQDITHRSTGGGRDPEHGGDATDLADRFAGGGRRREPRSGDINHVVEKLYREIERKRRIERERRGL